MWFHCFDRNPSKKENRGEIWIYGENIYYVRNFAFMKLGMDLEMTKVESPPKAAYQRQLVYRGKWYGTAANHNTLQYEFELETGENSRKAPKRKGSSKPRIET